MVQRYSTSLPEVHGSVVTTGHQSFLRRLFAFAGPAYLVSVGYMDPGNWATDLEGGASFGYKLLWVLVMSNFMAILLQTLSARLGIVSGRDLAQACREAYPQFVSRILWLLSEIAIAACDLAEVLGAAIGLNLLFKIPLIAGVMLTAADTLFILWFTRFGIRIIEAMVIVLVTIIGLCFAVEIFLAKPVLTHVLSGLIPTIDNRSLYVAIGILGATVMPHNLYLHSALVQTRQISQTTQAKREACRFNFIDSVIALNGALFVNAAILVLAGAVFYTRGIVVKEIQQAHELLTPLVGATAASVMFAIALLCSGQSSTLTGTMAGQIVMEGFLNFRMQPWLRRLITRMLAVIPAALTIWYMGDQGTYKLLLLSQVILSLQLPFAVVPLIHFTSNRTRMGEFRNPLWVQLLAWTAAVIIIGLNAWLVMQTLAQWPLAWIATVPVWLLLLWITFEPVLPEGLRHPGARVATMPAQPGPESFEMPRYRSILVPLDHSDGDRPAVGHAAALARQHGAKLYLLHVEEGVTSQVYGSLSHTVEVEAGHEYIESIIAALRTQGLDAEAMISHGNSPRREIRNAVRDLSPDLLVMGAHGHSGFKDLIFGTTINWVRHKVKVPLLVVQHRDPK